MTMLSLVCAWAIYWEIPFKLGCQCVKELNLLTWKKCAKRSWLLIYQVKSFNGKESQELVPILSCILEDGEKKHLYIYTYIMHFWEQFLQQIPEKFLISFNRLIEEHIQQYNP